MITENNCDRIHLRICAFWLITIDHLLFPALLYISMLQVCHKLIEVTQAYIWGFNLTPAYMNPTGWKVRMGKTVTAFDTSASWVDISRCEINPHIYYDFLYVVPRVSVSRRRLQCRVRHFTPTYVMTNELQEAYMFHSDEILTRG